MLKKMTCCAILGAVLAEFPAFADNKFSIERIGDVLTFALPAYAAGMTFMDSDYKGLVELGLSLGGSQLAIAGLQSLVKEPRPNGGKNGFPSGHAGAAFSGATFIHKRYGIRPAIVPYTLATFVGFSRVHAKWHYVHDVVAGAAVSALFTWCLVDRIEKETGVLVNASASPQDFHLGFNMRF